MRVTEGKHPTQLAVKLLGHTGSASNRATRAGRLGPTERQQAGGVGGGIAGMPGAERRHAHWEADTAGSGGRARVPTFYSGRALGASPSHALQNGCRQLQHANPGIVLRFHVDCNPIGLRKRIGNHFKFLTIQPDAPGSPIPKILNTRANFGNRDGRN